MGIVIPARAGVLLLRWGGCEGSEIPACAGMTGAGDWPGARRHEPEARLDA
jgi:hypothetical protein